VHDSVLGWGGNAVAVIVTLCEISS